MAGNCITMYIGWEKEKDSLLNTRQRRHFVSTMQIYLMQCHVNLQILTL